MALIPTIGPHAGGLAGAAVGGELVGAVGGGDALAVVGCWTALAELAGATDCHVPGDSDLAWVEVPGEVGVGRLGETGLVVVGGEVGWVEAGRDWMGELGEAAAGVGGVALGDAAGATDVHCPFGGVDGVGFAGGRIVIVGVAGG